MDINAVKFKNGVGLYENENGMAYPLLFSLNCGKYLNKEEFRRIVIGNTGFDRSIHPFFRQFGKYDLNDSFMRLLSIQLSLNIITDEDSFELNKEAFEFLNSVRFSVQKLSMMLYQILFNEYNEWYKMIFPYEFCSIAKLSIEGLAFLKKGRIVDTELTSNMRENLPANLFNYWKEMSTMFHDVYKTPFLFSEDNIIFFDHEWFSRLIESLLNKWTFEMINSLKKLFENHFDSRIKKIISSLFLQIETNYPLSDCKLQSPDFILLSGVNNKIEAVDFYVNTFLLSFNDFVERTGFAPYPFLRALAKDERADFKKELASRSHLEFFGYISYIKEMKDSSISHFIGNTKFDREFSDFINKKIKNIDIGLLKKVKLFDKL